MAIYYEEMQNAKKDTYFLNLPNNKKIYVAMKYYFYLSNWQITFLKLLIPIVSKGGTKECMYLLYISRRRVNW